MARLLSLLACTAALAYAGFFLFGPTYQTCTTGAVPVTPGQPSATLGPTTCRSATFFEVQGGGPGGAADLVRPLAFIALWTVAPFVALAGVSLRARAQVMGIALVAVALLLDASSIISMGGGFVYALLCGPLLLSARSSPRSPCDHRKWDNWSPLIGEWPSGKAADSGSANRRFESSLPS